MSTAWILAVALITQTSPTPKAKPVTPVAPGDKTVSVPATAPASTTASTPAAQTKAKGPDQKATLQSTIDKRKAARAKKDMARAARQMRYAEEKKADLDRAAKLAPLVTAQQQQAYMLQLEAQRTQAMQQMSNAMLQNAATNQMRFRLQSQQAGVPQIYTPNQGYLPYPGAVAAPLPYVVP